MYNYIGCKILQLTILKRLFGTLLSGKSVKQINYTEINRKRIRDRERLRIIDRMSIKDLPNTGPGYIPLPESIGAGSDTTHGLMHYTKILTNNNPPQAHIYRLINPLGYLKVSKLGTRSIATILSLYIRYHPTNHSSIKNVLKEIIRRFDELDTCELAHIAYSLSGVDKLKYDGLIENFTNRILLHRYWHFNFSELAKLLYFSTKQRNSILFDKCLLHVFDTEMDCSIPYSMINSAHLIAKSLESIDPQYLPNYYTLLESITNKCNDILCEFNDKLNDYLAKYIQNRSQNIVFDLSTNDIETLQLKHLMQYLRFCTDLGYRNVKYNTLLNEYIAKLLQITNPHKIVSTATAYGKVVRNFHQPIHAFIAYYHNNQLKKQYFPTVNDLIESILITKSNKVIANEYVKILNNLPKDISIRRILKANKQLLYDNFSLNEHVSKLLTVDDINTELLGESNYYGYYQLAKSNGINVSTFNRNIIAFKDEDLESLVNEINQNMKNDGDYRFAIRRKDTIYNQCLSVIVSNEVDVEKNIDTLSAILTVANEISWSFTMSQSRHLLYVVLDNLNKFNKSPILVKSCFYRLYNTILLAQLPLFRLHHQTYQLSLLYKLIQHDQCIRESIKDLGLEFFNYTNFTISRNKWQPIGPLVAANWFAKLSDLDSDSVDVDYGLGAYRKVEILGHPLKNHGLDILFSKSFDLLNKNYSNNDFTRFISDKPEIIKLVIEGTLKYI